MTRFQTFLLAVVAIALTGIAFNTTFGVHEARAGFGGNNLHPVYGSSVSVLFYNDGDNCLYEFKTKETGMAQKISCVTGLK